MLLMQLKGVNNEQILCTVQYTMLFSKYIVLETLACLITFIYTGCVETISAGAILPVLHILMYLVLYR